MNEFISLDKDTILGNKSCSINLKGIHSNEEIKVWRCKCNLEEDIIICNECKNTCHENHQQEPLPKMKAKDFICSCAKYGHNLNNNKENNNNLDQERFQLNNKEKVSCGLDEYYNHIGYNYYFENKNDASITCIFCANYCLFHKKTGKDKDEFSTVKKKDNENNDLNKNLDDENDEEDQDNENIDEEKIFYEKMEEKKRHIEIDEILKNDFKLIPREETKTCQCKNEKSHFPASKNLSNLARILKKSLFAKLGVNPNNFCCKILVNNSDLYNNITKEFISINDSIEKVDLKNQKMLENFQKDSKYNTDYLHLSKLFDAVSNYYKRSNIVISNISSDYSEIINFNFVSKLFEFNARENDFLVMIKKQSLRIFRKFYLNPKINSKNFYSDQIDFNITPIHRNLTNRNFSENFYEDVDIPNDKFEEFLKNLNKNINSYFTDYYTPKYSRVLFKLYAEYLHILNVLLKYRMDDLKFIENHINSIHDFLKLLMNNQQNHKIYLIKKQLLKLIIKILIKINDEKFIAFMSLDFKKNIDKEKYESLKFCFENSDRNMKIFEIFLMINQKSHSYQSKDLILLENIKYFLDLMMIKEDGFSNNFEIIAENKKFSIDFNILNYDLTIYHDDYVFKRIKFIKAQLESSIECTKNYFINANLKNGNPVYDNLEETFAENINSILCNINTEFIKLFDEKSKSPKDILHIQYTLYTEGYSTIMLHILTNIRRIAKLLTSTKFRAIYETIFQNLTLFTKDNPFLSLILVTHKYSKILFFNEPQTNKILFKFYIGILANLRNYSYLINPISFFDNFNIYFNKKNIFNIENTAKYEDLRQVVSFFDNLNSTCNFKIKPIISQIISEQIIDIFASKLFHDNVMNIVKKLNNDDSISNLSQDDQNIIYTYKNLMKILNHISDGHFVSIISKINSELYNNLLDEMLKIKYLHPDLRKTLIGFYTKSRIQLPYKIYHSDDLTLNIFEDILTKIPEMKIEEDKNFNKEKFQKSELEVIINELLIFPVNFIKYINDFKKHPKSFFKYFTEAVFMPCVNAMYKISYFNEKIASEIKYSVYRILVLFCKCFLFFLRKIEELDFYDANLFYEYLCIDVGLSEEIIVNKIYNQQNETVNIKNKLKEECEIIKQKLEADLNELDQDNFLIKDNNLFKKLIAYLKYYFLKRRILNNFTDWDNFNDDDEKIRENLEIQSFENNKKKFLTDYMQKLSEFSKNYNECKRNKDDLALGYIFADEQTFKDHYLPKSENSITDFKLRSEFKRSFFLLLLDNIIDFDNKNNELAYQFNEKNFYSLKKIVKIFKIDPYFCQNILLEDRNKENSKKILSEMINKNLTCLFQILFVEYNTINSNEGKSTYKNLLKIIEFIRLHCEDHNRVFQTYLCYFEINSDIKRSEGKIARAEDKFYFVKYILKIFLLIYYSVLYKLKKKDILEYYGIKEIHFFDNILKKIVELLVEVYQGNYKYNYDTLVNQYYGFGEFLDVFLKTFDDILNVTELEIIVMNFMTFYLSLLEDYDMKDEDKNKITKKLNLKLILSTIIYCLKKCYEKYCIDGNINKEDLLNPSNFLVEGSGAKLLEVYKTNSEFANNHLFILLTKCYILLKILSDLQNSKANDVLNNIKEIYSNYNQITSDKQERNYQVNIQKYEAYKFLSSIIKNVEINFARTQSSSVKDEKYLSDMKSDILNKIEDYEQKEESKESDTSIIKPVNFLIHNDSLFLTEEDLDLFREKIPIDNYNNKLFELVSNISDIRNTIKFKKRISERSRLIQFLSSLNYKYFEIISILIVLVINIMMQWTMTFNEINGSDSLHVGIDWLSIANLIFLSLIILNYMYFKYLSIDWSEKPGILYYLSFLLSNEIFALVWNLVIGIAATSNPMANFLFSLQLFSVISLFETMKTILITIQLRWKQFTSTAILIVILIIFYTGISFYFIRNFYVLQDTDNLNVCSNYIYCFFSIFSYGMRMGGGIGDLIGLVKYDDPLFWALFIFQWIFYFSIVLIMLNVINGIIVDTFQDLREKNNKRKEIKDNECYICSLNRIEFQINSLDFVAHKKDDHNFNNYIYYLIKIIEIDEHDLNSVDFQSLICCRKKQTSFFPMKKSITLNNKKKK